MRKHPNTCNILKVVLQQLNNIWRNKMIYLLQHTGESPKPTYCKTHTGGCASGGGAQLAQWRSWRVPLAGVRRRPERERGGGVWGAGQWMGRRSRREATEVVGALADSVLGRSSPEAGDVCGERSRRRICWQFREKHSIFFFSGIGHTRSSVIVFHLDQITLVIKCVNRGVYKRSLIYNFDRYYNQI